jgi:hypothetical protein
MIASLPLASYPIGFGGLYPDRLAKLGLLSVGGEMEFFFYHEFHFLPYIPAFWKEEGQVLTYPPLFISL